MKRIILLTLVLTFTACNKGDESTIDCETFAKVNGEDFCSYTGGYYQYDESTGYLFLTSGAGLEGFEFGLKNAREGTFPLGDGNNTAIYFDESLVITTYYEAISGSLTIDKFADSKVRGSFYFSAKGEDSITGDTINVNIANGKFEVEEY